MDKLEDFKNFEYLYDAKIRTEDGREFPIHRVLLAMRSVYFRKIIKNVPIEKTDFLIPKIHGTIMEIILEYIYTEKVILTENNVADILAAAGLMDIEKLLNSSRFFAISHLTITNCVPLFIEGTKNKKLNVAKMSYRFIEANFDEIVRNQNSRFEDMIPESLEQLLFSDSLFVSCEQMIWMAIKRWIEKSPDDKKKFLKHILPCMPFNASYNSLTVDVLNHPLVKEDPSHITLIENISKQPAFLKHRFPKILHLFTKSLRNESNPSETSRMSSQYDSEIFISYDENIDLCKSLYKFTRKFYPDVVLHGCGTIFVMIDTAKNIMYTFDILSKTLSTLNPLNEPRKHFNVVKLGNHIYVLGGFLIDEYIGMTSLERYNFNCERWELLAPHGDNFFTEAATFKNKIYLIGQPPDDSPSKLHVAQVYDPNTDMWNRISPPKVSINNCSLRFSLTVYKDQLFKVNGMRCLPSVQVYDACSDTWEDFENLPVPYWVPKAIVINDIFFVYEKHIDSPYHRSSVVWNESCHKWQVIEASSPLSDLFMHKFCTVDDSALIMEMKKDKIEPYVRWETSPFFVHLNS